MAKKGVTINDKELLEETFRLIQEGNHHTDTNDHWKAADCFAQAQAHLSQLAAEHHACSKNEHNMQRKNDDEEQQKIAGLYQQQSVEYLKKGRKSLVQALENDTAHDGPTIISLSEENEVGGDEHNATVISKLLHDLSEEDATHRLHLFGRLFAKEQIGMEESSQTVSERESSLEQRLAQLSQALPDAVKSETERIRDLNRGLARLGLQQVGDPAAHQRSGRMFGLFDNDNNNAKSEFEQVADIIAQAQDEVAVNGGSTNSDAALAQAAAAGNIPEGAADTLLKTAQDLLEEGAGGDSSVVDEDDDGDENLSDVDDDDADLTPELCHGMLLKLAAAQASLSELVAMFEEDADGDVAIEFEQARGKKVLRDTRLLLRQVAQKWAES